MSDDPAALCAYLRDPGGDGERQRAAVRALAAMPGVDVDLSGVVLTGADFSGARFGEVSFADTRFAGRASFAGAEFAGEAIFARAVFDGDAVFTRARFDEMAVFGRTRFRGETSFAGAEFRGIAWFGRGEEEFEEDDEVWETVEELVPLPWDELNEADPEWPVAVLSGDYQEFDEGGDGARFAAPVSFRGTVFRDVAWFGKARFAADADLREAAFGGQVHLDAPAVDLAGARWTGTEAGAWRSGEATWPWGWSVRDGVLTAEPSRAVRTDPEALAAIGERDPARRQAVVDALCAYLRTPLLFAVSGSRTAEQDRIVAGRQAAQRVLAAKLRPGGWAGLDLRLSGATLIGLDLTGCAGGFADFTGAQFHGPTRIEPDGWERVRFDLGSREGRATFHDGS